MSQMQKEEARASESLGFNFALLKSGSVILGVLYAITLILMIPVFSSMGLSFNNMLVRSAMILLSVVIIHFSINGLYYMFVTVPLILTGLFCRRMGYMVIYTICLYSSRYYCKYIWCFWLYGFIQTQNISEFLLE